MKIYSIGCSFTFGDELQDPQHSAWPCLVAKKFNAAVTNDAVSGGTNQRTVYRTIKNSIDNYDLFIIAWTTYTRFTFYKSDNNFEINFNPQLTNKIYQNEKYFKDWGTTLYKIWFNELFAFKLWLQQIIHLQMFLKDRPYLMINTFSNNLKNWLADANKFLESVKSLINFNTMNDEQIFEEFNEIQYYVNCIDHNKFYKWNDFSIVQLRNIFPCGPNGHILEQGHSHLADLIYNYLCLK